MYMIENSIKYSNGNHSIRVESGGNIQLFFGNRSLWSSIKLSKEEKRSRVEVIEFITTPIYAGYISQVSQSNL